MKLKFLFPSLLLLMACSSKHNYVNVSEVSTINDWENPEVFKINKEEPRFYQLIPYNII
jgi:hypothetical protein